MPTITIDYTPQPRQVKFHECPADEVLYGGAAGGGKSYAILFDALAYALRHRGSAQIMFRQSFPELEKSLIRKSRQVYPQSIGKYNESKKCWTFLNGSVIEFAYIEKDSDLDNYQGAEYDRIYFDELTHFTQYQFTYMKSRLRGSTPGMLRQIKGATNPGHTGHVWVKKRFIDIGPSEQVHTVQETDDDGNPLYHPQTGEPVLTTRCFIPANVFDNKALMDNDPNYIVRLMSLPDKERKQLLEGDWDVFAGQFFTEWNRAIHVVEPFDIPDHWRKIRCMDEGYNDPFVCLWLAFDEHGNCYVYREFVRSKLLSREQAQAVLDRTEEKIQYSVGDTSFWNKGKTVGESPADVFSKMGLAMMQATKERVNGWKRVREWLSLFDDTDPVSGETFKNARLKIFNTCTNLIEALPTMVVDEHDQDDIAQHELDHAPDTLRYGLMSWPRPARPAPQAKPTDPEQRWLAEMKEKEIKRVKRRKSW